MGSEEKNIYLYDKALLALIISKKLSKEQFPERLKISEDDVCELLKYLKESDCVTYVKTMGSGLSGFLNIKVTAKGTDVIRGLTEIREKSQTIHNQTNLHNSPNSQVAQTTGDNSPITQTQENIQISVLEKMIDEDSELDEEEKTGLKGIIKKIKEMKEAGETAEKIYEWVKKGTGICAKYAPYLIALLA